MRKIPNYKKKDIGKDIIAGIIVALISIPISMGYAQIAGLPMIYGLYGSVLPIIVYALITTTSDFVFGVDAAPAALTGGLLTNLGIVSGSDEAIRVIPVITVATGCWLLVFYFLKAGKVVKFISTSVMGGFVSGICVEIILMQVPKTFGGASGHGEIIELVKHIIESKVFFNKVSLMLSVITIASILVCKKLAPRFPMPIVMMFVGAFITWKADLAKYGVSLLPHVAPGLPELIMPDLHSVSIANIIFPSLTIAIVITAESLLASRGNAMNDNYKLNTERDVLAYSLANFAGAAVGACPINGSVSRTGLARQFGAKSHIMSFTAAGFMVMVLLFGTGMIGYLPVPLLTSIVICALIGATEFELLEKFWKANKAEFFIFWGAFLGVLFFGTIIGVVIGVVLSFLVVAMRSIVPPRAFLGVIPSRPGFYDLEVFKDARKIKDVVIYQFSGNIFFANVETIESDINKEIGPDTKVVILNAAGVGNIDIASAEYIMKMYHMYREKGIHFYMTGHVSKLNNQLREYGVRELIDEGAVRMNIELALKEYGMERPYPFEESGNIVCLANQESADLIAETEWAYGDEAEEKKAELYKKLSSAIESQLENKKELDKSDIKDAVSKIFYGSLNEIDEDELLDRLELNMDSIAKKFGVSTEALSEEIESRRGDLENKLSQMDYENLKLLVKHRFKMANKFKKEYPKGYEKLWKIRRRHLKDLKVSNPELNERLRKAYFEIKKDVDLEINEDSL
ncbi:MAG: STAS domain-containing protein [Clostridiales bacterium]|nr:STAS domain-containing protein [Clostridiales bacterium]MBS5877284.1 STAS domain-containing protein [Clostridiales bacterium]